MNQNTIAEFTDNLNKYRKVLLQAAVNSLKNTQTAEDVVQQASVIIWQKYGSFDKNTSFVNWAYTIVSLVAKNANRIASRVPVLQNQELYDEVAANLKSVNDDNVKYRLENILNQLDSEEKEMFATIYMEDMRIDEYAKKIGKPKQTVYNELSRIKKRIRI